MRRIALTLSTLFAAASAGCQTVGPAPFSAMARSQPSPPATGYSYTRGSATQAFPQAPPTVEKALLAAMDDLRMDSIRQTNEAGLVTFEGRTADARKVAVALRPQASGTRLTARVALFGDEPLSRALMDRVAIRLGNLPPTAIPDEIPSQPASNPYFSRSAVPDSTMFRDLADAPYKGTAVP